MKNYTNPMRQPEGVNEVIELYREQFELQRVPKDLDPVIEAKNFWERMERKNWRDPDGQLLNNWIKYAKAAVANLKKRNRPGSPEYLTPKKTLQLVDCCWRTIEQCNCALLLQKESEGDLVNALSSALEKESDSQDIQAFEWLQEHRHTHKMLIAAEHDSNWFNSRQRDLARANMKDFADEYFPRMAVWIEFISRESEKLTPLQNEMAQNYGKWLLEKSLPSVLNLCEERDRWKLFQFSEYPYLNKLNYKEAL